MKLCGSKSPGLIVTNSNTVKLDYHTDDEGLSNGWSLDYSTHSERDWNGRRNCNWTFCHSVKYTFHLNVCLKLVATNMQLMFNARFRRDAVSISWECSWREGHTHLDRIFLQRLHLCALWPRIQADDGSMKLFYYNKQYLTSTKSTVIVSPPLFGCFRIAKRLTASLPCAKAMGGGTSLCQNATVRQND